MCKLALACSIFWIADRAAVGRAVSTIHFGVGVLRQVVLDTLDFAWGCMSCQSESLARPKLRVNLVSVVIICEECGADAPTDDNLVFMCATCNSTCYHVKTGEEFILIETDVS